MGKDGRPLRDCILWMDQRRAENPKPLPADRKALFALAGMTETIEMLHRTSACNWIAENEPAEPAPGSSIPQIPGLPEIPLPNIPLPELALR